MDWLLLQMADIGQGLTGLCYNSRRDNKPWKAPLRECSKIISRAISQIESDQYTVAQEIRKLSARVEAKKEIKTGAARAQLRVDNAAYEANEKLLNDLYDRRAKLISMHLEIEQYGRNLSLGSTAYDMTKLTASLNAIANVEQLQSVGQQLAAEIAKTKAVDDIVVEMVEEFVDVSGDTSDDLEVVDIHSPPERETSAAPRKQPAKSVEAIMKSLPPVPHRIKIPPVVHAPPSAAEMSFL